MKPSDVVTVAGKPYTLIGRRFEEGKPMWLVLEKDNPKAEYQVLPEATMRPAGDGKPAKEAVSE